MPASGGSLGEQLLAGPPGAAGAECHRCGASHWACRGGGAEAAQVSESRDQRRGSKPHARVRVLLQRAQHRQSGRPAGCRADRRRPSATGRRTRRSASRAASNRKGPPARAATCPDLRRSARSPTSGPCNRRSRSRGGATASPSRRSRRSATMPPLPPPPSASRKWGCRDCRLARQLLRHSNGSRGLASPSMATSIARRLSIALDQQLAGFAIGRGLQNRRAGR